MKEKDVYAEISSIKNLMERSAKFISLSGFSGILAGVYALIGSFFVYKILYQKGISFTQTEGDLYNEDVSGKIILLALAVLVTSIITCILLTIRNARTKNQSVWNPVSRKMLTGMAIPLVTGGLFICLLLSKEYFGLIAPASLIFYGLSLVAASNFTYTDVKWLGILEIALGLTAALFPGFGLFFWAFGFGILHIIYGAIMYIKYER